MAKLYFISSIPFPFPFATRPYYSSAFLSPVFNLSFSTWSNRQLRVINSRFVWYLAFGVLSQCPQKLREKYYFYFRDEERGQVTSSSKVTQLIRNRTSSGGASGKESAGQCRRRKGCGFNPWVGKIPWSRKWQPAPIFLPRKFHGQRSLASLWSKWSQRVRQEGATEYSTALTPEGWRNWRLT